MPTSFGGHLRLRPRPRALRLRRVVRTAGRWDPDRVLAGLTAALDRYGFGEVTMIGHSFGGGIALGWAAAHPQRVTKLVLVDSLGLSSRWQLARDAFSGTHFLRMATVPAMRSFTGSVARSPAGVARAGWWASALGGRALGHPSSDQTRSSGLRSCTRRPRCTSAASSKVALGERVHLFGNARQGFERRAACWLLLLRRLRLADVHLAQRPVRHL